MKFLLDRTLKPLVHGQLKNELASDPDTKRKDALFAIVAEYYRTGLAERFVRRDGRIGWRASRLLLERIADERVEEAAMEEELDG